MKKQVLIYGLLIGSGLCMNMIYMVNVVCGNPEVKANNVLGFALLIILFSLIFWAVRNYRNKQLGGYISFGRAFRVGILITLIASAMYVIVWMFYYNFFVPDFIDKYIQYVLRETPAVDMAAKTEELENFKVMYKNSLFVMFTTFLEVFPIGLVVTLLSALILKKKDQGGISA